MQCPRCIETMEAVSRDNLVAHSCLYCDGVWISAETLDAIGINLEQASQKKEGRIRQILSTKRKCPSCPDATLAGLTFNQVEVDRCPACGGVFFDRGELESAGLSLDKNANLDGVGKYLVTEGAFWALLLFLLR